MRPRGRRLLLVAALLTFAALLPQAAIAWEDAPEVTPACQMNCDEPAPPEDTSASSDSSAGSSGSSSFEVNYDSPAYHLGQRIRQAIGLPSMYDLQESTPVAGVGQQQWQTALDYNQQGLNYYQQRDWPHAITAFRQALEYADHPTFQSNLRSAIASDYNQQGLNYVNQHDWQNAITAFRQALEYAPDAQVVQQNLHDAEAQLAEAEAAQHLQESQLAQTRTNIGGILERLTASLEAPSAGGPIIDSSVVDLRDAKSLVVDPAKVKGEPPAALEFMGAEKIATPTPSRKVEILLDALDYGHGNWEASFRYLQEQLTDAPDDPAVRGAFADALYAYYLDVGSGGTPEGNPLGRAREPEPTTREIIRDLERLGFSDEEARHTAAQLKADSAELAVSAQLDAQDAAEDASSKQPQEDLTADVSFKTAVYLGTALAAQGDTDGGLFVLNAVQHMTRDDPERQRHLDQIISSLEYLKRDADEPRTQ